MNILYIAEIVGKAGIYALKKGLPELRKRRRIDFVIACGDGATGGNGLGRNHGAYIRKLGAQVITTGERCFYKKDLTENFDAMPYVLRPENLNPDAPGRGARVFKAGNGKVAVAALLGQSCFSRIHGNSPYAGFSGLAERLRLEAPTVIVDFHAQASGEKQTLFFLAQGKVSAVIGSHNRVQTTDERVTGGTAVITDAGRTGSQDSVGGSDRASRIQEYLTGIPDWTRDAWDRPELQGVIIELDGAGKARAIEPVRVPLPAAVVPTEKAQEAGEAKEDG